MSTESPVGFRFGLSGSTFAGIDALVASAVAAEDAGLDSITVSDLPGGLSPTVALAGVARATKRLRIGTLVINTGLWDPLTLTRELASLDQVSGGRLEIALGSGIPQPSIAGLMPPDQGSRLSRLEKTVSTLKAAFEDPGITPGFVGRPTLRISGTVERTLRLAANEADGFIIASVPPVPKVELPAGQLVLPEPNAAAAYLERLHGYAPSREQRIEVGTGAEVIVTDDAEGEAKRVAGIHSYLSPEQVLASPKILIGTTEEIAEVIADRATRLGITYYVLRGAPSEQLGRIADLVRRHSHPGR